MKKLTTLTLLFAVCSLLFLTSCGGGIYEGEKQKYYVADLVGDPNNRNVFRATTVWSEDAIFEMVIPDYWEVKKDKQDEYNTDIYLVSDEYENNDCIVLPGTYGYGLTDELEMEQWYTLTPWGGADDYFFYERISEEERRPVVRVTQFTDKDGNYYLFELRYPEEGDYMACNQDFANMLGTFQTLDTALEDNYIEEEIFQPKWMTFSFKNKGSDEDRALVDKAPTWVSNISDDGYDYFKEETYSCELYGGVEDRDLSEAASYVEDILVLDNNDMAKKYTLYDETGAAYMIVVTVTHNEIVYNFELRNPDEACFDEFEAMVKSFRTKVEQEAANTFEEVNTQETGSGTTSEESSQE